jgi:hypothetical protein
MEAGAMVRRKERDHDRPRSAPLTAQAFSDVHEREVIPEPGAQPHERDAGRVLAPSAIRTVVVRIIDVSEGRGLEAGVFHAADGTRNRLWTLIPRLELRLAILDHREGIFGCTLTPT